MLCKPDTPIVITKTGRYLFNEFSVHLIMLYEIRILGDEVFKYSYYRRDKT